MQRAVETLLVIGILINLIKGADLILRPHQQKWLQDKVDTLALCLDYKSPLEWYIKSGFTQKWFWLWYHIVIVSAGTLYFYSNNNLNTSTIVTLIFFSLSILIMKEKGGSFMIHTAIWKMLIFRITGKKGDLIDWMFEGVTLQESIQKQFFVSLTGIASFHFVYFNWDNFYKNNSSSTGSLIFLTIFLFVVHPLAVIGVANIIVIIFSVSIVIAEFLLKIIRGIIWRIAEYNKGAFAAIILLVTVVLGVTEFYLKYGRK